MTKTNIDKIASEWVYEELLKLDEEMSLDEFIDAIKKLYNNEEIIEITLSVGLKSIKVKRIYVY